MRKLTRIIAALSAAAIAAGSIAYAAADRGERVTLIVEVRGGAVLEAENTAGVELSCSADEAADIEQNVRMMQAEVQSEIKDTVDRKAQVGYTYTHVFNGFSIEAYEGDIEKIKALPDVENVYISRTYQISEATGPQSTPYIDSGCEMMHTGYMHGEGYIGEGRVIAIIDDGFDVNHENFQGDISNPKLSKADIASLIENNRLSINSIGGRVSANRVYRSEKIPYAFNYYSKNSDTINLTSSHGTHVAGIAAGNNGTDSDGNKFVGAAPDAQLLLMACTTLTTDATIAATDDAVKLGADVISASYGADYIELDEPEKKAIDTAVRAGVLFSAAAGNASRGLNGSKVNAANIDYGGSAVPAYITAATSVANVNNTAAGDKLTISSSSSWGVSSSLELKPEITAPGGSIYSSLNNDKYGNMSGTSMAAPHMAGAAALMSGYIDKNIQKYGTAANKAIFIENLIMTGADVLMQDSDKGIPYSPRLQGAGLVNLEKAATTPVTLIGDTYIINDEEIGKSKLSLGEIGDELALTVKAKNHGNAPVTYDNISMKVITDSADENGIIGGMRELNFTDNLADMIVTVPANGETEITAEVTLDKTELAENMETFINGFFVDGFIFLKNSTDTTIPEISIPFTGFYGGWDSAPALDKTVYDKDGSVLDGTYMASSAGRMFNGSVAALRTEKKLGTNLFVSGEAEDYDDYRSEDFIGISPDNDGEYDTPVAVATPLRLLGKTDFAICDSNNTVLAEKTDIDSSTDEPYYASKFNPTYLSFDDDIINALPDGDYTFKVRAGFYAQKEYTQNESLEMKFYVDREKPVITGIETREDGGKTYLDITASDNRHLMGIIVSGTRNGISFREKYPIKGEQQAKHTFDITGADMKSLSAEAVDYALNSTVRTAAGLNIVYTGNRDANYIFEVSNTSGGEIKAAVTMALYRDGALVGISSKNDTIPENNSYEIFNLQGAAYDTVKVFVWDSLDGMMPLYEAFEF